MPNLLLHGDNYGDVGDPELGRDLRCAPTPDLAARALVADLYVVVASFESDDPWDAFRDTQNGLGSPSWSRSPGSGIEPVGNGTFATPKGPYSYRSTQAGDAVVVDGVIMVLTRKGFEVVEAPLPSGIRAIDGTEFEMTESPRP